MVASDGSRGVVVARLDVRGQWLALPLSAAQAIARRARKSQIHGGKSQKPLFVGAKIADDQRLTGFEITQPIDFGRGSRGLVVGIGTRLAIGLASFLNTGQFRFPAKRWFSWVHWPRRKLPQIGSLLGADQENKKREKHLKLAL